MYETFFQMEHTPFSRNTPVADLYESPAMADTLGRLAYAADRQLFAVVTADAGCGKSTLIRRFVTSLSKEEYLFLYLSDSKLTPRWFYKGMLDQLGIESKFYRGDAKRQLQKEVEIIRGVQKKKVVCILDEAHLLEKETIAFCGAERTPRRFRADAMQNITDALKRSKKLLNFLAGSLLCNASSPA